MSLILDGRVVSERLLKDVQSEVELLKKKKIVPKLVVVWVGEDPASEVYIRHKESACKKVGILFELLRLPSSISQEEMMQEIQKLNEDKAVTGFIVQMPLPPQIKPPKIIKAIDPYKDVDGFHAYNLGKAVLDPAFEDLAPCTPKGIIKILEHYQVSVEGLNAVVIGRSNIVGKPIAMMLLNRDATVTVCHKKTKNLKDFTMGADLIVAAVGKVNLLTADMVNENAVVIDVGINRLPDGKIVGDADFEALSKKVRAITPVPGGVGPMTVACLMQNTVTAAKKQHKL